MMTRRVAMLLLLVTLAFGAACGRKKTRVIPDEQIRANDPAVQAEFDAAVALLEAGKWPEAIQRFRMLQAQYPEDPIAVPAEMYAARGELGDLRVFAPQSGSPDEQALSRLATLGGDRRVDDRIRYAALAYYSAALASVGEGDTALVELAEYPSWNLSPLVIPRDRPAVQALVGEALGRAGRFDDALMSWGALNEFATDEATRRYARSRGFAAAKNLDEAALADLGASDDSFVRAVAGWTLLDRRVPRAEEEEVESLRALLARTAPDLVAIEEGSRVAPLSASLASRGAPPRLAIGVALPLTGSASAAGARALDGALIAAEAFRAGVPETTLVFVDSARIDPGDGVAVLRSAGASAIVGPLDPKKAGAWVAAANAAQLPIFAMTTEPLQNAGDWGFRWFIDARSEAHATAKVAVKDQGDRRIAILVPNIGYGRQMAQWFREAAVANGATIVLEETYDRSATDFSSLASRVAREKPDAIYIPDTATKVGEVVAFLAQANVWGIPGTQAPDPKSRRVQVHYLGTSLWHDPDLLRQSKGYVGGALIPAWASPAFEGSEEFFDEFDAIAQRRGDDLGAFAFDAVEFVRSGFERGATRPEQIRDAARAPKAYRGVCGPTRFGANGEPIRVLRFATVKGGEFVDSGRRSTVGLPDEI